MFCFLLLTLFFLDCLINFKTLSPGRVLIPTLFLLLFATFRAHIFRGFSTSPLCQVLWLHSIFLSPAGSCRNLVKLCFTNSTTFIKTMQRCKWHPDSKTEKTVFINSRVNAFYIVLGVKYVIRTKAP